MTRGPVVSGTADQRRRERWALGLAVAGVVFATSYTGQRLVSAGLGEPSVNDVVRSLHTPLYWRLALSALHGAIALPLGALVLPEPWVRPVLRFGPLWVVGPVMLDALLLVAVP